MSTTEATQVSEARQHRAAAEDASHSRRWLILALVAMAQLVVVLDATIVNIALPSAQADLGFGNDSRQWVVTAYALGFGGLLLLGGRLSDMLGRRRMFLVGLIGFGVASAIGGFAVNTEMLIGARALQGVFGAMLAPAALSLLTSTFRDGNERGTAYAIYGAVAGGGGAIGLILGGALTQYLSWEWCLLVNVPIVLIVAALGARWLAKEPEKNSLRGLDVPGVVLSVSGLVALVYGLANAESNGWTSALTYGCIALGLVLLAVFVAVENRAANPLLPMRILLDRSRGGSLISTGIVGAGMFGVFLFLTYFLSVGLGYSPLETGVSFLPMIGGIMVAAQVAPVLVRRIGLKLPVTAGMVLAAVGMLLLTAVGLDSTYTVDVLPALIVMGVGIGLALSPSLSAATYGVRPEDAGAASALTNTMQQIGGSIGTAVLSAFAATAAGDYLLGRDATDPAVVVASNIESYVTAFWWSAGIFAVGAVLAALLQPHGAVAHDPEAPKVFAH